MRILVAHPAQQHSFRLAAALKRAGVLGKYATTVYYKKGSVTALISRLLRGKFRAKAEDRHCRELLDSDVIQFCEGEGLLKLLAMNTGFFKKWYYPIKYHTADRFARKAAKYAVKHKMDAVITYDDSSPLLFEELTQKAPNILRILDMSSASLMFLREIYEADMKKAPEFAERMKRERSICWDPKILDRAKREIGSAQRFLVPSQFVARSLEYSGVRQEQMDRCPYGVDISQFPLKDYDEDLPRKKRPVRFVYVGGVKELKGISYLLNAFLEIPKEEAELTVVGQYSPGDKDIAPYLGRAEFTGTVLHSDIPGLLQRSDVFVIPSLGDSYALAVMEAAACGLPAIVSDNTGVQDIISEGENGFIIPIQSKDALKEKIRFFINHPERIEPMGRAARRMAEENTWDAYYDKIGIIAETSWSKANPEITK